MIRRVALFRGINVGGRNRIPMADLRDVFVAVGCSDVASIIQSGNICFASDEPDAVVSAAVRASVIERFSVDVPITFRGQPAFETALAAHPFRDDAVEPKLHHIMFLTEPAPADAADLIGDHSPGAQYLVDHWEIHLRYPHGSAHSTLTVALVDRRLSLIATARNLSTCEKIATELKSS